MFRNGNDVIEWVNQQLRFGIKPGLERMEAALARLGNPHLKIRTIHICLLYTSPSPRDPKTSRMPSSA